MQPTNDAIIIGAGPGGLSSAILLAQAGLRVKIFERLPFIGGRTSLIEKDGFKFDLGPTFFLYPRVLSEIFSSAGYNLNEMVRMTRLDPQYRISFGSGGHLDCTSSVERMRQQISKFSVSDAQNFEKFLNDNRLKLKRVEPCLESSFLGWKSLLSKRLVQLLRYMRPFDTIDSDLKRFFTDERIRLAFCFQSKYLGMSPYQCPSLFTILSFIEYEYGVWHPEGGCASITAAMAKVAQNLGVEIYLNTPVDQILFTNKRATGVRTNKGSFTAGAVVLNADFARAMTRMVPNEIRKKWTNEKLGKKKFSCSTFMMYLGVKGSYDLPHHNIHISENYRKNLEEIEKDHVLSNEPSFYVQNASVTDPTLAPKGHSSLYVLVPVSHQHPNINWYERKEGFRKLILSRLANAGFHDVEKRIVTEHIVTPQDWDSKYEIYKGATFNLSHTLGQMLHLRPNNRFEDLDGLYLVGGGTHPGSGLPVIFESAKITSSLLLKDLGHEHGNWMEKGGLLYEQNKPTSRETVFS